MQPLQVFPWEDADPGATGGEIDRQPHWVSNDYGQKPDGGWGGGRIGDPTKTAFESAAKTMRDFARSLTKEKLNSKNCRGDLDALKVTEDQVREGAAAANFINGVDSTVTLSSLYVTSPVPSVRQAGARLVGTVGDKIAQPGTVAVAQLGGHDIYINPRMINSANPYQNLGIVFHEVLHNITGLTDPDIQRAFGLSEKGPSDNITQKLIRDCF